MKKLSFLFTLCFALSVSGQIDLTLRAYVKAVQCKLLHGQDPKERKTLIRFFFSTPPTKYYHMKVLDNMVMVRFYDTSTENNRIPVRLESPFLDIQLIDTVENIRPIDGLTGQNRYLTVAEITFDPSVQIDYTVTDSGNNVTLAAIWTSEGELTDRFNTQAESRTFTYVIVGAAIAIAALIVGYVVYNASDKSNTDLFKDSGE